MAKDKVDKAAKNPRVSEVSDERHISIRLTTIVFMNEELPKDRLEEIREGKSNAPWGCKPRFDVDLEGFEDEAAGDFFFQWDNEPEAIADPAQDSDGSGPVWVPPVGEALLKRTHHWAVRLKVDKGEEDSGQHELKVRHIKDGVESSTIIVKVS